LRTLAAWIRKGGVLVRLGADAPQTVEGRTQPGSALLGLATSNSPRKGGVLEIKHTSFLRHLAARAGSQADATVSQIDEKALVLATVENRPAIWAMPHRKGWVIVAAGAGQAAFNELVRDVTFNLSRLDASKRDAIEVDTDWDGVYTTLLANHEVMLHNFNSEPRTRTVAGTTVTLPPKSLRSVLIR
jgi:hypothetical protein